MFKGDKILCFFCFALFLASCSNKNNNSTIKFSSDRGSIIINNIDEVNFYQAKKIYLANPETVNFFAVESLSKDSDGIETKETISGKLKFEKGSVIFTPDKPFKTGERMLVQSYIGSQFITAGKMFQNEVKNNLAPQEQILMR